MVVCAWVGSAACPVQLVRLVEREGLKGHCLLFQALTPEGVSYANRKPIAYSDMRLLFLDRFEAIGLDTTKFGTHSCRAGGATLAVNKLWMEHGGWRSAPWSRATPRQRTASRQGGSGDGARGGSGDGAGPASSPRRCAGGGGAGRRRVLPAENERETAAPAGRGGAPRQGLQRPRPAVTWPPPIMAASRRWRVSLYSVPGTAPAVSTASSSR